jgi:DNA end-binding protein Ku
MSRTHHRHAAKSNPKESEEHSEPRTSRKTGPRPIWSGFITFGLISVPVKLYSAIKDKELHFNQLHEKDKSRVHYKIVCATEEKEITRDEIVPGYQVSKDHYVVVKPEELDALAPKTTRGLEIVNFVKVDEIDPMFFNRGYYLVPDEHAEKAYVLLQKAMGETGVAALAKFVMRGKEYMAVLRPKGKVLALETMHFEDEVLQPEDVGWSGKATPSTQEMKMARQLIDSQIEPFDPSKVKDDYRLQVMDLIHKKAEGQEVVVEPAPKEAPEVIDLMAALQKSLAESKQRKAA